ncbi:MAG: serine/threonine protein kinase [Thermoleophilaceae bacterium]|nr:serine/threonine protein kinase [Thermoleophilaceae bacterium]
MERPPPEELATAPLEEEVTRPLTRPSGAAGEELLLGRYRLERRLGSGGHGVVWLARDERLERDVAVKAIPRGEDDEGSPRAEREARAAARLNHPGIVALYELAADDDTVYLVSELVEGRTYAELLREGALSDRDVACIGVALCGALAHAHGRGVIHRDIKPQNVIVVAEPAAGEGFAKLADFGVAHLADLDPLTRTGDVVGTLAYMAPEQAEGQRVTESADVYSLALTLYEGWTGRNPVRAASPAATARRLGSRLPSLAEARRDLPPALCAAIDAALDPDPLARPALEDLRRELAAARRRLADEGGLVETAALEGSGIRRAAPRRLRVSLPERLAAGLAAGALALAALALLGPKPPLSPLAGAALAAASVALLPRLAWLALAAGTVAWLALADEPGTALVVALPLVVTPLLLPGSGPLWSLPALAPLLGAAGLAPAFPALAGLARGTWRRAGLAAAGVVWLVAAEALVFEALLYGPAHGAEPRARWAQSAAGAAEHALGPALESPVLLTALAWAAAAALLPLVVRGRNAWLDAVRGVGWAAALVAATGGLDDVIGGYTRLGAARGAAAGALAGVALAVVARLLRGPAGASRAGDTSLGWPTG